MDGYQLTRTQSSLLRSSPTIRSSIQSLSSVSEIDLEEQKPHRKKRPPVRSIPSRLSPVLAITFLSVYTLYTLFNRTKIPNSENLLLALVFLAILLFFVFRNKELINNKFKFCKRKYASKPVEWSIGASNFNKIERGIYSVVKEGVEFYTNGDFYEGEFHKGICNGSGVYSYFGNGRYEGDWIDGKYDGFGVESWAKGSRFRGQYKQGLRHGFGIYIFYTGDSYSGEWCNGQSHGIGMQSCGDGSSYNGEFKCGVKHGIGCYQFRNGDKYFGEYFGDKVHGFGIYRFANGHCYEGSWHEGRKQGYGMYTFRNGDTKCGEWDTGSLKTSLPRVNDAVIRAVEAARKTSENAIHLRRVDEQVNNSVKAANKAANAARVAAVKAVQNRIDGKYFDTINL